MDNRIVVPGKRRKGPGLDGAGTTTHGRYEKYEMTENRQYWKMTVKTGPQRRGDGI